ncbi:MAG: hypothetical protein KAT70_08255 [Thermoplasmata archaeon]|nr:hypothetical protein [Thermoplasmata archaeon]
MMRSIDSLVHNKKLLAIGLVLVLIGTTIMIWPDRGEESDEKGFIFYDTNEMIIEETGLVVGLGTNQSLWPAASCIAPIAGANDAFLPTFFDDRTSPPSGMDKYPTSALDLTSMGDRPCSISIGLARNYWERTDMVIVVEDYETALWVGSLAASTHCPILFSGCDVDSYLAEEGVKSVIAVGDLSFPGMSVLHLRTQEDVWEFYLEQNPSAGENAYLAIANPHDIDVMKNGSAYFLPAQSLATSLLAPARHAFVATGNFTANLTRVHGLGFGCSEAGAGERGESEDWISEELEIEFQQEINNQSVAIDNVIDTWTEFLKSHGGSPKHVGLVGGPAALPMIYLKSPVWFENVAQEEKGEEYLATDMYYSDLELKLKPTLEMLEMNYDHMAEELYTPEVYAGRIIGTSLYDATALVTRSACYWGYEKPTEPGPTSWGQSAEIVNSLVVGTSDSGAARHQQGMFAQHGVTAKLKQPHEAYRIKVFDETGAVEAMEDQNIIIYDGHGYPDGWYWLWSSTHDNEEDFDRIGAEDIYPLNLHAAPVFGACCLSSALDWPVVWETSDNKQEMKPDTCVSLSFIHSGALCYIGATEESWGMFFGGLATGDPDMWGYGDFDMPTMFYDMVLANNETMGEAYCNAKVFYRTVQDDDAFCRVCQLETVLYGDPAACFSLA